MYSFTLSCPGGKDSRWNLIVWFGSTSAWYMYWCINHLQANRLGRARAIRKLSCYYIQLFLFTSIIHIITLLKHIWILFSHFCFTFFYYFFILYRILETAIISLISIILNQLLLLVSVNAIISTKITILTLNF